ncbi:beta-3 adrenergic receptor-like [Patiria miniata]|uniref:G-protein coupled receptors family 1 profile domain-containing protein n=1 Tax=Patiria miniata TaxID=46514 RepID=A0A914B7P3_PATMI|nr:beta-3 adrenergic receptor-like [Patiria miniata]
MSDATPTGEGLSISSVYDSYTEKQLLAALYGLIFVAGVLGNSSVLLAVVLSRKPRTTTNVFVVNLAVADLITCLSLPIMILAVLSENREKLLVSNNLCSFQGFVLIVCIGCSFNNIASIAVYRAMITRQRNRSRLIWLFNRRCVAAMVAINWLIPFAVGILPVVSEFGSYEYDDKLNTCSFNPTDQGSGTFSIILVAIFYPVQLLATFLSYSFILFTVKNYFRRVNVLSDEPPLAVVGGVMRPPSHSQPGTSQQHHLSGSAREAFSASNQELPLTAPILWGGRHRYLPANRPPSHAAAARQPARARPRFRRNLDVTFSLFLVVFFFILCCTPYSVLIALLEDKSQKYVPFLGALLVSNSCINPVIYTARHPDFKAVIRCIMLCRFPKIPMKSAFLLRLLRFQRR